MPFKNNNAVLGIPDQSPFQVGASNVDRDAAGIEQGVGIPWASNKATSWVYYDCTVMSVLDSGIAVHSHLPQSGGTQGDTLSSCSLDDPRMDAVGGDPGVNLKCRDQYADIVQRMGHARYWFRLFGEALRIGYQIPIPAIVTVGGVPVVPYDKNPQWAFNRIRPGASYGGVILWHARWSLWYTTLVPPVSSVVPAADPVAHILGSVKPPDRMQAPYTSKDDNAQPFRPGGIVRVGGPNKLEIGN